MKNFLIVLLSVSLAVVFMLFMITRRYSKLERIGLLGYNDAYEMLVNPENGGTYMLWTSQAAKEEKALMDLIGNSNSHGKDLLLVFGGELEGSKKIVYLKSELDVSNARLVRRDGVTVYALSWRRLKMPPGVAVD
jgi:hypothetical protein